MVLSKNKAKTMQKSLYKATPNLSRVRETDNRNRVWINPDTVQLEMLQELKFIADNISANTPQEVKQINLKDILVIVGEDPRPDSQYDLNALKKGVNIELEHTNDVKVAKKIAKDHLDEMKDYYDKLEQIESK